MARTHGRKVRVCLLAAGVVATMGVGSCTSASADHAADGRLSVVAAFYPVQEAAQRVGGDLVQVTNLTAPGVEPHDLELTPDEVEAIQTADVVLYLGDGFQPAVEDAVADAPGITVDLLADMPTVGPAESGSEPGLTVDPHVWLDPLLYARMVRDVADALARADPRHADVFARRADSFDETVTGIGDAYASGLRDCQRTTIVTSHAAFGYLAHEYGLTQEAISGVAPDVESSAQRIAQLTDLVRRDGITTIFTEDLVSPKVAETLADEAGVTTQVLHTIEGLTPQELAQGTDYASQMTENLTRLEQALGCS